MLRMGMIENRSMSGIFHYLSIPALQHSGTPLLQYANTPILRHQVIGRVGYL
jgi:hypothetical protein